MFSGGAAAVAMLLELDTILYIKTRAGKDVFLHSQLGLTGV